MITFFTKIIKQVLSQVIELGWHRLWRIGFTVRVTREPHPWTGAGLSRAASVVWGKSSKENDEWLPLWRHLADTAQVAGLLWDEWVPDRVRSLVTGVVGDAASARRLVVWLAGIHDIGKATPSFTRQVRSLAERGEAHDLDWSSESDAYPRDALHAVTGQLVLNAWLADRHGWKKRQCQRFSCVVGAHHGAPPEAGTLKALEESNGHRHPLGWSDDGTSTAWRSVQWELLDWAAESADVKTDLALWAPLKLPMPIQHLVTGIVIMADWIASNENYFPYAGIDVDINDVDRVGSGWRSVGLPPRWTAVNVPETTRDLFESRFDRDEPWPIQTAAVSAARTVDGPALFIVEAAMGEGKTEAALAIAEIAAERFGHNGVVFGLPTRATGDAVLRRVENWTNVLADACGHSLDLGLGHGHSQYNEDYNRLLRDGFACIEADWRPARDDRRDRTTPGVAAHRWMAGRKKTLLSQFVVVTVDQLLFAALKMKHITLRHLGLAGKVVVIDEAHAYDVYMSQYLDRAIEWLAHYGCSVVVLSATLPPATRERLVTAYHGRPDAKEAVELDGAGYPSVTVAPLDGPVTVTTTESASTRSIDVDVEMIVDDLGVLADRLRDELRDGGCALVLRNTVSRAQETAKALRETFGDDIAVRLVHSRFTGPDRKENDVWLRDTFGPRRSATMPATVVVATQVAEQSLDIDFDLLVTDLAPLDLVLQRLGRVHRHDLGERPEHLRRPRCLVTGADWGTSPVTPVSGSTLVYHPYLLLRSAAVLVEHCASRDGVVSLPSDITGLVRNAYGNDPVGPTGWEDALRRTGIRFEADQAARAHAADQFRLADPVSSRTLIGLLAAGVGDVDDSPAGYAQVRDGGDSIEVIVVVERDGRWFLPTWNDDGEFAEKTEIPNESDPDRSLSLKTIRCRLALPYWFDPDAVLDDLETRGFPRAWQRNHWLKGELVLPLDAETLSTTIAGHRVTYSRSNGLVITRPDPPKGGKLK